MDTCTPMHLPTSLPPAAAAFPAWTRTYSLLHLVPHTHPCSYVPAGGRGPGVRERLCHKVNFSAARQAGP